MDWLTSWFFDLLYVLQKSICYLVDFICNLFYKLVGIETVNINGTQGDLLMYFIQSPAVKNAFFGVMLIGVILLTVFAIVAIIRSETVDGQNKKTKGQILVKAGQSFIIFIVIPVIVLAGIVFTNAIMIGIDASMTVTAANGSGTSFGGQILVTSGYDAYIGPTDQRAEIEQQFINGTLDFNTMSVVKKYYDLSGVNYFVGILSGFILLLLFAIAVIVFIQRLFDIVLLYIVSPVSISTIPLDDGQRFKIWREMFVSKILGAYGIIFAMNLFFIITPLLSSIRFFDNDFQNGIVSLLILIGGAFAVTKANIVISKLTGNNAGTQEVQQMMSNIHLGYRFARGGVGAMSAMTGRLIGGSEFRHNQKKGMSFTGNVTNAARSSRNRHEVKEENKTRSNLQKAGAVTRLATMPVGVLKDALQGGVITAGKNFLPRMKNIASGSSFISRADVNPKADKLKPINEKPADNKSKGTNPANKGEKNNKQKNQTAASVDRAKRSAADRMKVPTGKSGAGTGVLTENSGNNSDSKSMEFTKVYPMGSSNSDDKAASNKENAKFSYGALGNGIDMSFDNSDGSKKSDTTKASLKRTTTKSGNNNTSKKTILKPGAKPKDGNKKPDSSTARKGGGKPK